MKKQKHKVLFSLISPCFSSSLSGQVQKLAFLYCLHPRNPAAATAFPQLLQLCSGEINNKFPSLLLLLTCTRRYSTLQLLEFTQFRQDEWVVNDATEFSGEKEGKFVLLPVCTNFRPEEF